MQPHGPTDEVRVLSQVDEVQPHQEDASTSAACAERERLHALQARDDGLQDRPTTVPVARVQRGRRVRGAGVSAVDLLGELA